MDTSCKWLTTLILVATCFTCLSFAGCLHVVEMIAAVATGIVIARLFYVRVCVRYHDRFAVGQ